MSWSNGRWPNVLHGPGSPRDEPPDVSREGQSAAGVSRVRALAAGLLRGAGAPLASR